MLYVKEVVDFLIAADKKGFDEEEEKGFTDQKRSRFRTLQVLRNLRVVGTPRAGCYLTDKAGSNEWKTQTRALSDTSCPEKFN